MITIPSDGNLFAERISQYLTPPDQKRVMEAFHFAREQHGVQKRGTGEPFYTHPLTVAYYLAEYHLDAPALIAALLHDVEEDTFVSQADIAAKFGEDVALIVHGVTKFEQSADDIKRSGKLDSKTKKNATLGRLFAFMSKDVRVVLIKIFDRLHNMRTMDGLPHAKQVRKAKETLQVYAPLASRLGLWQIKTELETLSFQIINQSDFNKINNILANRQTANEQFEHEIMQDIQTQLQNWGIEFISIEPSIRHPYSIYRTQEKKLQYRIDNVPRIMIVVPDRMACYLALGALHKLWQPQPAALLDFIARPRDNLYRAIHSTVFHEKGHRIKLRIRSQSMSTISNIGVLGKWAKLEESTHPEIQEEINRQVGKLIQHIDKARTDEDSEEDIVGCVVDDILGSQIAVYTPKGACMDLPKESTPLDFAYAVHTQVGHTCSTARVNGMKAPLNSVLKEGDMIEIIRQSLAPRRNWLQEEFGYLYTSHARSAVKRWFRNLDEEKAIVDGQKTLQRELVLIGLPTYKHQEVATLMGFDTVEKLYAAVGCAILLTPAIGIHLWTTQWTKNGVIQEVSRSVSLIDGRVTEVIGVPPKFKNFKACATCKPDIGDEIIGYIRNEKTILVHKEECRTLPTEDVYEDKKVRLQWALSNTHTVRPVEIMLEVYDRANLLHEITTILSKESINIRHIQTKKVYNSVKLEMCLEVNTPVQLVTLLHQFRALVNVRKVYAIDEQS